MFFLSFGLEDVVDIVNNALRGFFASLCEIIYPYIAKMYQVFTDMGLVFYSDDFEVIYDKISLIIGIFMVFRVTFWLIELLVSPEKISDKEKSPGKIIQKVLVAVILLATTPRIFKLAAEFQYQIVIDQTIPKLMSIYTDEVELEDAGKFMAAELFINFYTINEVDNKIEDCEMHTGRDGIVYSDLRENGELNITNKCLSKRINENENNSEYVIDFNWIFAFGVGIAVFWLILMYCISVGGRYVQLIFLQVIAPVPIMCYLTPGKDNMFSKWLKQCTTTYLDLFIRMAIISIMMLLSNAILSNDNNIILGIGNNAQGSLIQIFLVLGLLTFAKKAPELIQELLPKSVTKASGDFGLSLKKRAENMVGGKFAYGTLKRAPGYVAGGATGLAVGATLGAMGGKGVGSRIAGGLSGAARGFATGSKKGNIIKNVGEVKKNQATRNSQLQQWRLAAGKGENDPNTFSDYMGRKLTANKKAVGFEDDWQKFERAKKTATTAYSSYKELNDNSITKVIEKEKTARALGHGDLTLTELDQRQKTAQQAVIENNKTGLLSTADGERKLSTFLGGSKGQTWLTANGLTSTTNISSLNAVQKDALADAFIKDLQEQQSQAEKEFAEKSKEFGFLYQIEQAFGIDRDKTTGQIKTDASGKATSSSPINEGYKNKIDAMNNFIKEYDEVFGITTGANPILKTIGKGDFAEGGFDLEKLTKLMVESENGNITSQTQLRAIYDDFDMIKILQDRVNTVELSKEIRTAEADDKFSSGKH